MDFIKAYDIGVNKPNIQQNIYNNWQEIVDSLASIADVPSALIMHVLPDKIEVARTSHTQPQENPYDVKASEHLGCGLYCETVIKEKAELHVQNALKDEDWKNNPDVSIDMVSYYGQPLLWSDGTVYGTICILDKKDLIPSVTLKELVGLFRKSIENDLQIIELSHTQEKLLKAEIQKKTKYIQEQNVTLNNLNRNLEQRVKEEVEKSRKKDQKMIAQARLAQMGEMIGMIAHQWRQPLSTISATSMNLQLKSQLNYFNIEEKEEAIKYEEYINKGLNVIDNLVQNLSITIDNFRYFYTPNKKTAIVKLEDVIEKSLNIINSSLEHDNIKTIEQFNSKEEIKLYDNEMMQVILNILKNAQDNFQENQTKNPYIKITTEDNTISICDNGGGIPEDIIKKIFDPYFSTKDKKNGTGLGLYMSKTIVEEHHSGMLSVENIKDGACFTIELGII